MKLSFVLIAGATAATAAACVSTGLLAAPAVPAARRNVSFERLPPAARVGRLDSDHHGDSNREQRQGKSGRQRRA